ncbi:hypothetical protein BDA96_02G121000 [Sorghum bicolor]|uniref:Uncharacterized protein n=2 Tax=Sorghum bicolor TaxID=4558 RepID=A0A921RLZ6_SORBI|nr:hypothetical protein BDA96_02G121000 [Sorghum bicolor]OQU88885.1 hypothetical protein SORBI_3002G115025 [Sorghum bicolor]
MAWPRSLTEGETTIVCSSVSGKHGRETGRPRWCLSVYPTCKRQDAVNVQGRIHGVISRHDSTEV